MRLAGRRRILVAVDERRVATARPVGGAARSAAARELARAARAAGGEARVVRLARAGARWVEARPGARALGAQAAAAAVLGAHPTRVLA
jgi:hypothetical protein